MAAYTREIQTHPDAMGAMVLRGEARERLGQWGEALLDYTLALEVWDGYWYAYYKRAKLRHDRKDYLGALSEYGKALSCNPGKRTDPQLFFRRGRVRLALGETTRRAELAGAIRDFDKALELRPGHHQAQWEKTKALCVLERWEDALAELANLLSKCEGAEADVIRKDIARVRVMKTRADAARSAGQ